MYPQPTKLERVFITPEDRTKFNKIENKTKTEIISYIEEIIQVRVSEDLFIYLFIFLVSFFILWK